MPTEYCICIPAVAGIGSLGHLQFRWNDKLNKRLDVKQWIPSSFVFACSSIVVGLYTSSLILCIICLCCNAQKNGISYEIIQFFLLILSEFYTEPLGIRWFAFGEVIPDSFFVLLQDDPTRSFSGAVSYSWTAHENYLQ
jgi:hypothetical protein